MHEWEKKKNSEEPEQQKNGVRGGRCGVELPVLFGEIEEVCEEITGPVGSARGVSLGRAGIVEPGRFAVQDYSVATDRLQPARCRESHCAP